jgi:hypothetical protein
MKIEKRIEMYSDYISYSLVFGIMVILMVISKFRLVKVGEFFEISTFSTGLMICFIGLLLLVSGRVIDEN